MSLDGSMSDVRDSSRTIEKQKLSRRVWGGLGLQHCLWGGVGLQHCLERSLYKGNWVATVPRWAATVPRWAATVLRAAKVPSAGLQHAQIDMQSSSFVSQ
jgi:hypothetical protein